MMNLRTEKWIKRIDFFFLSTWVTISIGLAIISLLWFGADFRGYYAAAQVLLAGGNPYDYHQVADVLLKVTGKMGNNPYYYPPWFAWFFVPLAIIPFQIARSIWMLFNFTAWNIGLWQLSKTLNWPPQGWKRYSLFIISTFSFAWITWRYEQAGILVFAILVAALLSASKQNWLRLGILLALLLIKPNITLIVVTGMSLWLIRQAQWRPVLAMTATLSALLIISTLITPNWFKPFMGPGFGRGLTVAMDGPEKVVASRINTTMLDWLASVGAQVNLRFILYGISVFVAIVIFIMAILYSRSLIGVTSLSLLISYAITPYALQYDYPPLVITLFWALSLPSPSKAFARWRILFAGFIFSVSIWQQSIAYGYWMIIGLIALVISALYFRNSLQKDNQSAQSAQ
jgi:hypothetical protein